MGIRRGLVSVLVGAALVFFVFPKHEREEALRASYHAQDAAPESRLAGEPAGEPRAD